MDVSNKLSIHGNQHRHSINQYSKSTYVPKSTNPDCNFEAILGMEAMIQNIIKILTDIRKHHNGVESLYCYGFKVTKYGKCMKTLKHTVRLKTNLKHLQLNLFATVLMRSHSWTAFEYANPTFNIIEGRWI